MQQILFSIILFPTFVWIFFIFNLTFREGTNINYYNEEEYLLIIKPLSKNLYFRIFIIIFYLFGFFNAYLHLESINYSFILLKPMLIWLGVVCSFIYSYLFYLSYRRKQIRKNLKILKKK